jgi:ABC-2 type transport system ATP-binding protein
MTDVTLSVRALTVQHGHRQACRNLSFDLRGGQVLGLTGPVGAGTSVLLRALIGAVAPVAGEVRLNGLPPRVALRRLDAAYFAGEATLPTSARADRWCNLWTRDVLTPERRALRRLPRGVRQLLGLRAQLCRHPLAVVLLDDPWEGLDLDGTRWLDTTLQTKRDRGAAIVVSSRQLDRLAELCDKFLFFTPYAPVLLASQDLSASGRVSAEQLRCAFDRFHSEPTRALAVWAARTAQPRLPTGPP